MYLFWLVMTDYTEELSGYLESEDPAKVRKGLSIAKKIGRPVLGLTGRGKIGPDSSGDGFYEGDLDKLGVLWTNALKVQGSRTPPLAVGPLPSKYKMVVDGRLQPSNHRLIAETMREILMGVGPRKEPYTIYEFEDEDMQLTGFFYFIDEDTGEEVPCDDEGNPL